MRPSTKCWEIHSELRSRNPQGRQARNPQGEAQIDAPEHEVLGNPQGRQMCNLKIAGGVICFLLLILF